MALAKLTDWAEVPLKLTVLDVPGVSVPVPLVRVMFPIKFIMPAPPDIFIRADGALVAEELNMIFPFALRVPVVIAILATLEAVLLPEPPILILPVTVAVPELISHPIVLVLEVG